MSRFLLSTIASGDGQFALGRAGRVLQAKVTCVSGRHGPVLSRHEIRDRRFFGQWQKIRVKAALTRIRFLPGDTADDALLLG